MVVARRGPLSRVIRGAGWCRTRIRRRSPPAPFVGHPALCMVVAGRGQPIHRAGWPADPRSDKGAPQPIDWGARAKLGRTYGALEPEAIGTSEPDAAGSDAAAEAAGAPDGITSVGVTSEQATRLGSAADL